MSHVTHLKLLGNVTIQTLSYLDCAFLFTANYPKLSRQRHDAKRLRSWRKVWIFAHKAAKRSNRKSCLANLGLDIDNVCPLNDRALGTCYCLYVVWYSLRKAHPASCKYHLSHGFLTSVFSIVVVVVGTILSLLSVGLFSYFPHYAVAAVGRARYYLYGTDSVGREFILTKPHGIELWVVLLLPGTTYIVSVTYDLVYQILTDPQSLIS